jgi:hypothetical protein
MTSYLNLKIMCRKVCSECPWVINSKHNRNMISSIIRWVKNGSRKTTEHRCHMISTDLFGEVNEKNICIGSKNIKNGNKSNTK